MDGILLQFVWIGNRRDLSLSGLLSRVRSARKGGEDRALSPNDFPALHSHGIYRHSESLMPGESTTGRKVGI